MTIKFKIMTYKRDKKRNLLTDSERLTTIGKFMCQNSLDEIPEIINVLNGEMSLVWPRPLMIKYLPLYSAKPSRRHNVKPETTRSGWILSGMEN